MMGPYLVRRLNKLPIYVGVKKRDGNGNEGRISWDDTVWTIMIEK